MKSFESIALRIIDKEGMISDRDVGLEEFIEVNVGGVGIDLNLDKLRLLGFLFLKDKGFESF